MSTSSDAAARPSHQVRPFPYAEVTGTTDVDRDVGAPFTEPGSTEPAAARQEQARALGRQEGEAKVRAAFDEQLERERKELGEAIAAFHRERAGYYQRVEGEIVQLALAIARKVLHREAQLDPLLLAGIAHIALDKIEAGTEVVVRVHPHQAAEWQQYFARHSTPQDVPEIVADAALDPGRCILQTRLGTAELGLETQLKEIERGLFDLLAQRPTTTP